MFGYQDMIVDFRGIPTMQQYASTVLDNTFIATTEPNRWRNRRKTGYD
jgi:2-dehydro-3-deoxyphosphooctonate aldolase (KDO 8-P synthase)